MASIQILLADDDESDRMLFTDAFEELKLNTKIDMVHDGVALLEYLDKKKNNLPQFLFLDLNMPLKDGKECLDEIRNTLKLNEIIIAIFSTSASEKDIEDTFVLGANVYIQKPGDYTVLKECLNRVVSHGGVYKDPPFQLKNFILRI
jgi:CheY-like chemotaxis protein